MLFNSYEFIFVFLPPTIAGYWLLAHRASRTASLGWLLLASVAFYAYGSFKSLVIIAPSIFLDYLIARTLLRMDPSKARLRGILFTAGIATNIVFLGYFKYKNFFLDTANVLFGANFELAPLLLPLGISFITFQKIAFLADVHSGQVKAVRFGDFLLFTLFFPRTIAGPIVRYGEIVPQLGHNGPRNTMSNLAVGLCLFSIGLFKKAVIADSIAQFVPPTFDTDPSAPPPDLLAAWTGALAYTFQLYFDFSGYSDMAMGIARMLGVRLPMNFNSPLKASSIVEFWSRWHITLTRFLTTYVYTPIVLHLTRARSGKGKPVLHGKRSTLSAIALLVCVPTLITMTISGFWHGAGWQFIVWGVMHGVYLMINQSWRILRPRFWPDPVSYERVMRPVGFVLTFAAVVIAFVFFRATSVASALSILSGMAGMNGIFDENVQLLRTLGMPPDWSIVWGHIEPLKWMIVLFAAVTVLPNSLELLRRFQPALDFSEEPMQSSRRQSTPPALDKQLVRTKNFLLASNKLHARLTRRGVPLNRLTAAIAALLWVLGVTTLSRGTPFVYFQF